MACYKISEKKIKIIIKFSWRPNNSPGTSLSPGSLEKWVRVDGVNAGQKNRVGNSRVVVNGSEDI